MNLYVSRCINFLFDLFGGAMWVMESKRKEVSSKTKVWTPKNMHITHISGLPFIFFAAATMAHRLQDTMGQEIDRYCRNHGLLRIPTFYLDLVIQGSCA